MMNDHDSKYVSADSPKVDPAHDRLGHAPFAKHLATAIKQINIAEGMVIAINGDWGSGKTTLLNFVESYLTSDEESETANNDQTTVVKFNPWWFSGQEDLTKSFFEQLLSKLDSEEYAQKEFRNRLAEFAHAVSGAGFPQAWIPATIAHVVRPKNQDVSGLKEEIEEVLVTENRILVIIDDIDRLTSEEIRQLFRLVKAVANFPNVMYLLAFDKHVVAPALNALQVDNGYAYMEKIIQLQLDLPYPDKTALLAMFAEALESLLLDAEDVIFDQDHWTEVFLGGVSHFIETPRDIVRLINALSVTYGAVRNDVNLTDFVAIEALRVFSPVAYEAIRNDSEAFTGHSGSNSLFGSKAEDYKPFHDEWLQSISDRDSDAVKQIVTRLFPKLQTVWGSVHYGQNHLGAWRKELRVCSPDIFPVYFRLSLPEGAITRAEIESIISISENDQVLAQKLLELSQQMRHDGTTRVSAVLERLGDYSADGIPEHAISSIFATLFTVGDKLLLPEDEQVAWFSIGNEARIANLLNDLIKRIDKGKRFEVLKSAIVNCQAISTVVDFVSDLGKEHGRLNRAPRPTEAQTITYSELVQLETTVADKLQEAADLHSSHEDSLLQRPKLEHNLFRWRDWAGNQTIENWFAKLINDLDSGAQLTTEQLEALKRFDQVYGETYLDK